ncbi:hypothetical protein K438DRAFT_1851877 [Mycena galopus ATCC 62051]|nr:hypothetical protein K438DRAFT_1892953 [Mycena galopus ATCC 62051]KAF8171915.1 hypothetical protein K438DRAFT_1851877 [Mycena galopus ATCC 62051]
MGGDQSPIQSFHNDNFVLNPPAASHTISNDGRKVSIRALPETDWWRVPPPEPVESRTGAFFGLTIDATRDFSASVWIRGEWGTQFDHGCLMLLAGNDSDVKGDWIKAGVEVETGEEYIGAVVTSPWSDWAIAPAAHSTSTLGDSPYALYMKIVREGPLLTVSQHLASTVQEPAAADLVKIREVRGFNVDVEGKAQAKAGDKWRIGPMVCGPKNKANGTGAEFQNFSFQYL